MQHIKAILFDFGGVVVNEGFDLWKAQYKEVIKNYEELDKMDEKIDKDEIPINEYHTYLAQITNQHAADIQKQIVAEYAVNQVLYDTIKVLHEKGIKTAIVSNFPKGWFWEIFHRLHLENIFDAVIISSEIKSIKPDPKIYNEALKKLNVLPEETLFTDDREQMVDGAKHVGLHGIVFVSAEDFKSKLVDYGILL